MAVSYFGLCDSSGNPTQSSSDSATGPASEWNNNTYLTFTCPGSGTQNILELSAMVHVGSGSPNIRLAVYSSDYSTLIAQGTSEVVASGASDSWQGHMTAASVGNATLTGGTVYILVVSFDSGNLNTDHAHADTSYGYYNVTDFTGGYSGSLTYVGSYKCWPCRCGVEAAGGPAAVTGSFITLNRTWSSE